MEETQTATVLWAAEDHLNNEEWDGDLGDLRGSEDAYNEIHPRSDGLERRYDEQEVDEIREAGSSSRKWAIWTNLLSRFRSTGSQKQTGFSTSDTREETTEVEVKPVDQQPRRNRGTSCELERALDDLRSMMSTMGFAVAFEDRYI